jgi:hypothetical protein
MDGAVLMSFLTVLGLVRDARGRPFNLGLAVPGRAAAVDSCAITHNIHTRKWFIRAIEETADGLLVHVQGLGELGRDTSASFYAITPLDPAEATVVAEASPRYRTTRLWLESTSRKTPFHSATAR